MHIDLITATKSRTKEIHGTDNGKRTGCGINLIKVVGQYTSIGEMTDIAQITCEKCKTVLAKRMIRESNKEMQRILKEEQKMHKREEREEAAAAKTKPKNTTPPKAPSPAVSAPSGEYVPPSMRSKQEPIESPIPAVPTPRPVQMAESVPAMPSPVPQDDVLAQFAIPSVPTAPAAPALSDEIPEVPTSIPSARPQDDDVLAQFAIPSVPTAPAAPALSDEIPEVPTSIPSVKPQDDDVLAQFAIPSVPTAPAAPALSDEIPEVPTSIPSARPQDDDVLAQFAIPSVPTAPAAPALSDEIPEVPTATSSVEDMRADVIDDVPDGKGTISFGGISAPSDDGAFNHLANSLFDGTSLANTPMETDIPEIPEVPAVPASAVSVSFSAPEEIHDIMDTTPVTDDDYDPFRQMKAPVLETPVHESTASDISVPALDIPVVPTVPQGVPVLNVPDAPAAPVYPDQTPVVPTLDVPTAPAAPAYPQQPAYTQTPVQNIPTLNVPTAPAAPAYPQQPAYTQTPVQNIPTLNVPTAPAAPAYPQQAPYQPQNSFFSNPAPIPVIPPQPTPQKAVGPTPLFVGYGADGRQIFQTYDANGQPIPITEPVYSTPPQEENPPVLTGAFANGVQPGASQVMDIEELMSAMGIEDKKPVASDEKIINYTEYRIPQKKKKKPATLPKSAQADEAPKMPISAAEAKRQKKLDKINQEFEKKLKDRGIDPTTGAFVGKGSKKK